MSLNFDSLPKERPAGTGSKLFEKGHYPGVTKKAEIRVGKESREKYMVVPTQYTNPATGETTVVYDNFYVSDKPLNKYKLRQFLTAINVILAGEFELEDLCKVINNKPLIGALKIESSDKGYPDKNIIDVFDDEIYYNIKESAAISPTASDVPFTFNAEDAADSPNNEEHSGADNY